LPEDVTEEEVVEFFSKCGLIKKDPETANPKIKIYRDDSGIAKGDGLVCYYRAESVDLAFKILDGAEIKPGHTIKLQEAVFEQKGDFVPTNRKPSKKAKLYNQKKELTWEDDDNVHIILKHAFDLTEAKDGGIQFFDEVKEDIRAECQKLGDVASVKIFQRNPEGVVAVKFKDHESATKCLQKMNGRWFGGKQLIVQYYDGWTNYDVGEDASREEEHQRTQDWEEWLNQD